MSILNNHNITDSYGTTGQATVRKMNETIAPHSLSLTYKANSKRFTVLGSSKIPKEVLEKIFAEKNYIVWTPKVLDTTDGLGNRIVELVRTQKNLSTSS